MQHLLKLKPPRLNYLMSLSIFVFAIGLLTSVVSIILFQDYIHGFTTSAGMMTASALFMLLMWVYDEIKKYERWSVVLTESSIIVPDTALKRKSFQLSELDRSRTLVFNSEKNLRNRIRYTLWSTNGSSIALSKSFYGRAQINALLEKIDLS